jgi:hypothetical protein
MKLFYKTFIKNQKNRLNQCYYGYTHGIFKDEYHSLWFKAIMAVIGYIITVFIGERIAKTVRYCKKQETNGTTLWFLDIIDDKGLVIDSLVSEESLFSFAKKKALQEVTDEKEKDVIREVMSLIEGNGLSAEQKEMVHRIVGEEITIGQKYDELHLTMNDSVLEMTIEVYDSPSVYIPRDCKVFDTVQDAIKWSEGDFEDSNRYKCTTDYSGLYVFPKEREQGVMFVCVTCDPEYGPYSQGCSDDVFIPFLLKGDKRMGAILRWSDFEYFGACSSYYINVFGGNFFEDYRKKENLPAEYSQLDVIVDYFSRSGKFKFYYHGNTKYIKNGVGVAIGHTDSSNCNVMTQYEKTIDFSQFNDLRSI